MIPLLALTRVTRQRFGPSTLDETGASVRATPEETQIDASIQAAPATRRQWLPEGLQYGYRVVDVITYTEIRGIDPDGGTPPDRIVHEGVTYEVQMVDKLPPFAGQPAHFEAVAVGLTPHRRDG